MSRLEVGRIVQVVRGPLEGLVGQVVDSHPRGWLLKLDTLGEGVFASLAGELLQTVEVSRAGFTGVELKSLPAAAGP